MLPLEKAQQRILSLINPLSKETVPLSSAAGRILAEEMWAAIDLPPFDNSAMDGYAVLAQDTTKATAASPAKLKLVGEIPAGQVFEGKLNSGTCARIFTGSPLPAGADAVIMQEDTRPDSNEPGFVFCLEPVKPWENVRFKGEDLNRGQLLMAAGNRITATRLNLLAATGLQEVAVTKRPSVGIVATGSELRESGQSLSPGQIYESNRVMLAALCAQTGAQPVNYPIIRDHLPSTEAGLKQALEECDLLITSGGASVGDWDLVRNAFESIGGHVEFWKIAIRPGKPFIFGQWNGKFLLGLPGNPVSAFVTFLVLARPALLRLQGAVETALPQLPGISTETFANRGDRRHLLRVTMDADGQVSSAGTQASHILSSLALANGLLDIPPGAVIEKGQRVQVSRWDF